MILSPLIFKEKLTLLKVMGFLVVLMGSALVNGKAALLLDETMTAAQIIGAVCIIGGAMVEELVKPHSGK